MFLALTSQTEYWDTSDEILFAGSWCARYDRRSEWQGLRHSTLPNPWDDADRLNRAVAYCDSLVERLLGPLAAHLNAALSVKHDERYWRILIGRWLSYHVQQMYGHHVVLEDAFALHPGLKTTRLDPGSYRTPKDLSDFVHSSLQDHHHLQIFSVLLSAREEGSVSRAASLDFAPPVIVYPKKRILGAVKRILSRVFAAVVPPGFGEVLVTELNLSRGERLRLFARSRFKVLPYLAHLPADYRFEPVHDARRLGLARVAEAWDSFEAALIAALPHHFPTLYLEGYAAARAYSLSRIWRTPRVIFTAIGWECSEPFRFVAAECSERGSALWGMQHGGVYGQWERADAENYERSITDRFYCWGWARLAEDTKVRDLPHPQLSRTGPAASGDGLLLVVVGMPLRNIFVYRGLGGKLGEDYIARQARFLQALPQKIRDESSVRFFAHDFGWRQEERLRDLYPALRRDDNSIAFQERLRTARVAVFDCPMTTYLEALAANVPSVLTWNPDAWRLRTKARPYFDRLKEAGILFDDPEAAAAQAARVYDDPSAWWDSPPVRAAREDFAEHFALNRPDWLELWLEEIRNAL